MDEMREGNRDVGEVWEVRKKKKKTGVIRPISAKALTEGGAVKTPEAASTCEK